MRQHFFILLALIFGACSDPVPDIDRTQGNLIKKSDLAGEWHMLQTVTGVPPTAAFTFEGETSSLERIRWEIREDLLIAYRSYALVRGAEAPSTDVEFDGTENPVAAYRIKGHFDIIRNYNSSTGEQSNVIAENSSDRLWHERDYIRVDWSQSTVLNHFLIAPTAAMAPVSYFVQEEEGGADAFYRERDQEDVTQYFDVLGKMFVEPDLWGCIYTYWGLSAEDCTSAEIEYRTSFSRVDPNRNYEPFHYSDQMMSRFGYFRTEFFTYDEQRGVVDSGRRFMINRHNIWEKSLEDDGTPIPMQDRTLKAIPYYLSPSFPDDPLLMQAALDTMGQWNDAVHHGLRSLLKTDDLPDVFILCQNPVAESDPSACGERGFAPRMGDLRYSTLHWVDTDTLTGLLGYGPSAADPITGELISGKAYVYGAAISTWAQYAVDVLRYFNDELDLEQLVEGAQFTDALRAKLDGHQRVEKPSEKLKDMPLTRPIHNRRERQRPARPEARREDLHPYDRGRIEARMEKAREAGLTQGLGGAEFQNVMSRRAGAAWESLSPTQRAELDPTQTLNPLALKRMNALRKQARARSVDMHDMIAPDIVGLAQKYAGRTDYDQIWHELRAEIFASTAEHEVGHTLGLRHNFQGSYDSLNYPDEYWHLREENLFAAESLADIYELSSLTESQHQGLMRQKQYSSIMDYGYSWHNDTNGLGKYDRAALVFGYTAGSVRASGDDCETYPSIPSDSGCLAKTPGLIEVFKKSASQLDRAGALLTTESLGFTLDDPGLPSVNLLERYHYTTVALAFPSLDDLADGGRTYMPYADYLTQKSENDRSLRVPYLFCSDEWEGGLLSCHVFDQGADPFEVTRARIDQYRAYYPFVNYRRDRVGFEVWHPLINYYFRIFLPLSDYFQSWYVAPTGFDPLFDRTYDLAINSGFSLLGEVLSTPPYGTWCESANGEMVHQSDEPVLQGERVDIECVDGGRQLTLEPGVGRRRFSAYDPDDGYYFFDRPREAGHYWTTLAAIWAITDPEAYVIGVEGDTGTYAISYFDWFDDEFSALMNGILGKDYPRFAPRAVPDADDSTSLRYVPAAPIYDSGSRAYYNAETGVKVDRDPTQGPLAGPTGLCDRCTTNRDCAGHTGALGGIYCQSVDGTNVCLQDCTDDASLCPEGTACDNGNCIPADNDCAPLQAECSAEAPFGGCDAGATCVSGECVEYPWEPVLRTKPTFSLATDILFYGFLYTTASYSTRFNDQLNVFRVGTENEVDADPALTDRFTFTDPIGGVTFAAVQPACARGRTGGATGQCGSCSENAQCAGFTGRLGGIWCQQISEDILGRFCLQDCTNDADLCGEGTFCNSGNCIPVGGATCSPPVACSPNAPNGTCDEDFTCVDGTCLPRPNAQCRHLGQRDTGAVQLVQRGIELSKEYNTALDAWYSFDGDAETDNQLARTYFRARFYLNNHVDLLNTVVATYSILGRIY